tara:strand:+ start:985 stop:1680 length:696 start_codon:yes stop_codon:yes gene_type:complete
MNFSQSYTSFNQTLWHASLLTTLCAGLLVGCGGANTPVNTALALLDSDQPGDRERGLEQLQNMKSEAKPHASRVVDLLNDNDVFVRKAAIQTLIVIQHKDSDALSAIGKLAMEDSEDEVKSTAMNGLLKLEAYDEFAKVFKKALADGNTKMRESAAMAIAQSGQSAAAAAETDLAKGLKDQSIGVRMSCAMAIGNLAEKASAESKAALQTTANDKDKSVADAAKAALERLK